jgi:hypothetical protein
LRIVAFGSGLRQVGDAQRVTMAPEILGKAVQPVLVPESRGWAFACDLTGAQKVLDR